MPEALSAIATVVEVVVPFGDGLSALSPPDSGIVVGTGAVVSGKELTRRADVFIAVRNL